MEDIFKKHTDFSHWEWGYQKNPNVEKQTQGLIAFSNSRAQEESNSTKVISKSSCAPKEIPFEGQSMPSCRNKRKSLSI